MQILNDLLHINKVVINCPFYINIVWLIEMRCWSSRTSLLANFFEIILEKL
jgi:hypothetical protein